MEDQANTLSAALARDSPGTGQRRKTNVGQAMNRQLGLRKPRDVRLISLQCRDILQPMTASQPCTGYERIATTRTMAISLLMGFRSHLLRDTFDEREVAYESRLRRPSCISQYHAEDRETRDGHLASERKLNLEGTAQPHELEKAMFASQIIQPEENEPPPVVDKAQKEAEEEAAWMNFIFDGDIDDAEKAAFQEAAQEAARVIRPSSSVSEIPIDNSTTSSSSHCAETVATCGTSTFRAANGNVFSSRFSPDPHFGHPAKRTPFPPKFSSDPDLKLSSAVTERKHQTYHDYSETYRHSMPYNETSMRGASSQLGYSSRTTIDNMTDGAASQLTTDNASIIAQPPQSEASEEAAFTFTQPKNFVGSRVTSAVPMSMTLRSNKSSAPKKPNKGRKKRGHQPQAKRCQPHRDGSAFIRALPNYNDDPIDGSDD
ncbi:hypothetical protein CGCSCA1_v000561 [Colletotrichum siamense]|nr:hypothetical protein CGCSCA1_v000561 [Colletotrichum siamense]